MDFFNLKQGLALFLAASLVAVLVFLSLRIVEKDDDKWTNLAVVVLGLSTGWLLGIFISPYDGEASHFKELGAAVTAFVSGYILSKADAAISKLLSPDQVIRPVSGFRMMAGLTALILALIMTYVGRSYLGAPSAPIKVDSPPSAAAARSPA